MFDFGIVTTCKNAVKTIDSTIWSIVSQEGGHSIRYHIQDASSHDGTVDKLKEWQIRIQKNSNAYLSHITFSFSVLKDKGMYDGLSRAFADLDVENNVFMGWLNADDVLLPGAVDAIVRFGRSQPGVGWITGYASFMNRHGRLDAVTTNHFYPREILAAGLADGINWCFLQQESTFWRKSLYQRVGGLDTSFKLAGDWDLWRRFAQHVPLVHMQYSLGVFRSNPGQLSTNLVDYWTEMEKAVPSVRRALRAKGLIPDKNTKFKIFFADMDDSGTWLTGNADIQPAYTATPRAPKKSSHILTLTPESKMKAPLFQPDFEPNSFTFSRTSHMRQLIEGYLASPYGKLDIWYCDLKAFQDAFCAAFIDQVIPAGAKILEVGGGNSRICSLFHQTHECWNIDKFEGIGNGPKYIPQTPYKLVIDYIGSFNPNLPNAYFDFVFSISTLEHLPEDEKTFQNVLEDIQRILKPGGWSVHLFDVLNKPNGSGWWTNQFVPYLFNHVETLNKGVDPDAFPYSEDIYWMPKKLYEDLWRQTTKKSYEEFGAPGSLQVFWRKRL